MQRGESFSVADLTSRVDPLTVPACMSTSGRAGALTSAQVCRTASVVGLCNRGIFCHGDFAFICSCRYLVSEAQERPQFFGQVVLLDIIRLISRVQHREPAYYGPALQVCRRGCRGDIDFASCHRYPFKALFQSSGVWLGGAAVGMGKLHFEHK